MRSIFSVIMLNSMLSGSPLLPNKSAEERFETEFAVVLNDLSESFRESVHQACLDAGYSTK